MGSLILAVAIIVTIIYLFGLRSWIASGRIATGIIASIVYYVLMIIVVMMGQSPWISVVGVTPLIVILWLCPKSSRRW